MINKPGEHTIKLHYLDFEKPKRKYGTPMTEEHKRRLREARERAKRERGE